MFRILKARWQQRYRTMKYPAGPLPEMPDRFAGRPVFNAECRRGCRLCQDACPTGAIRCAGAFPTLDLGRCIFCRTCEASCPDSVLSFSRNPQLAAARREDLNLSGRSERCSGALSERARTYFGRSLKLRQVSAGGCNACEADVNVLGTPAWDMSRFGIQFVASPRHADGLLITGPVTANMRLALEKTYAALPEPRIVIACGTCAVSGGIYSGHPEAAGGAGSLLPVDLYIPGCPPHPLTTLDALLRFIGRPVPDFAGSRPSRRDADASL